MSSATAHRVGDRQWNERRGEWQRWTGSNWKPAVYSRDPYALRRADAFEGAPISGDQRVTLLKQAVAAEALNGASVVLRDRHNAVLGYQRPVNHFAHALLSLLTAGIWVPVWIVMAVSRKEDRVRLDVDGWGNVWASFIPR